jgi:flagellar basal body-associated protein FliL
MPDSQWLDQRGKKKNYLWLVILAAMVCIAAGVFIRNNSDVLGAFGKQKKEAGEAIPGARAPLSALSTSAPVASHETKEMALPTGENAAAKEAAEKTRETHPGAVEKKRDNAVPPAVTNESVALEGITCRLMDKSQPSIRLSLLLSFPANKALRREILVKRDNLKVMAKRTIATKSLDDMIVDSLRRDLAAGLNSVLENGVITDIEFKEFRIDKVE